MVLVQKWQFFQLFFLGNIGQKNVFYEILGRRNAFLGYKKRKFKKWKNWHFSKGVNPWFWSKNGHFSNFFLGNIGQENVFYEILGRRNAFLGYKNRKLKKWKNFHFSKGVNPWFWSKNGRFSNLFFRQYRLGKGLLWYSRTKEYISRLYKQKVQKVEKLKFFQRGYAFGPIMKIFQLFFFRQYRPGKYVLWYSRTKKCLSRL